MFDDFVKTFRKVKIDNIIITDIYDVAGRETKTIVNWAGHEVDKLTDVPKQFLQTTEHLGSSLSTPLAIAAGLAALYLINKNK